MRISFCGHASFNGDSKYKKCLLDLLEELIDGKDVEFYLGGYGSFDNFAYECCREYKKNHTNAVLIFVTPYINESFERNHLSFAKRKYDAIIYPPLENVPPKFAITHRNRYMVDISDVIISYISHSFGGAYQTYRYAQKKKKRIFNIYKKI